MKEKHYIDLMFKTQNSRVDKPLGLTTLASTLIIQDSLIQCCFSPQQVGEKKSIFDCIEFYYHWKAAHPEAVRGRTRYIDSDSDEVSQPIAILPFHSVVELCLLVVKSLSNLG